jgi:hypothetical protein
VQFYGFDTFTGLPKNWDHIPSGTFSTEGQTPQIDDSRCTFEVGLFHETLPNFLLKYRRKDRLVVNLDADLYSSTLFVLSTLVPVLQKNDLLILDDFCSLKHPTHVFRAFSRSHSRIQFLAIMDSKINHHIESMFGFPDKWTKKSKRSVIPEGLNRRSYEWKDETASWCF